MLTTINITEECIRRRGNPVASAIRSVVRGGYHVDASKSPIDICSGNGELTRIYTNGKVSEILAQAKNGLLKEPTSFELDIREDFLNP